MKIVFLGPPGAGKGTQAARVCGAFMIPHISTGDIFRRNINERTELGLMAKRYMDAGDLVPDDVTVEMVLNRLKDHDCITGYLLDGFPRTIAQAQAFGTKEELDAVVCIEVPREQLIGRLTGRRVCSKCSMPHHISTLKGNQTECPKCGGELVQRADDSLEAVGNRQSVYESQTAPLINYYTAEGILRSVDGTKGIDEVFANILSELKGVRA